MQRSVGKILHLETGINKLDSWHDILHAVVDVAVSAGLCGCQDFMQVLQNTKLPLGPVIILSNHGLGLMLMMDRKPVQGPKEGRGREHCEADHGSNAQL